jgi:enamine deaminase RidA (YjgF/YER057c/UK114 family)
MMKSFVIAAIAAIFGYGVALAQTATPGSDSFEKKNYSYNEWSKGRFSEIVTVTNPGKLIFVAGLGAEQEGDGKIIHTGDFMAQCRYAFQKMKKYLALHGATLADLVKMTIYMTDIRHFTSDWGKCRSEAFAGAAPPSSTLVNVSQLAWPHMMVEIDGIAVLAK